MVMQAISRRNCPPVPPLQVSDFGLSIKMDVAETHISGLHQGTLTHMAPEVIEAGLQSKKADV